MDRVPFVTAGLLGIYWLNLMPSYQIPAQCTTQMNNTVLPILSLPFSKKRVLPTYSQEEKL